MTLDMERAIRSVMTKNQNVVFAPLSIVGALALVLLGSDGQTKDELTHFMGVATGRSLSNKTDTIHKSLGAYFAALRPKPGSPVVADVRVANGIFYEDRYMIKKQYAQLAEELYQSEIFRLDFGNPASARFVNK
ncbi:serpin B7-like isoform X2 [Diaphorina citri]|uniref:Serpin B7-like isoform X1 n=1 Tax=Diaphorina citri TaxID=121845 RepID=A0A3Q0INY8_DIACI|nr:serpin B7-like isoform X1 [Diaphorina citri]XP_026677957.1 serpin B7-like isoform X2 [Diaphorina citri]